MRPQQQNRRMRGRGNNGGGGNNNNNNNPNRKGPNPLTRNYESNGPDVKIRGSAQQIAEKYTTLARDAQSSGDRVMAENYLQHAEHYNRIIAAAQAQMPIQQVQQNRDDFSDDQDEDRDEFENAGNAANTAPANAAAEAQSEPAPSHTAPLNNGSGPQPVIDGTPAEVALNSETTGAPNGGRHRERRPRPARPEAGPEAEAATPASTQADADEGEQIAAPRRGRRPRRGERRPDETAQAGQGGNEPASDAGEATAETSGGDTVLAPVES